MGLRSILSGFFRQASRASAAPVPAAAPPVSAQKVTLCQDAVVMGIVNIWTGEATANDAATFYERVMVDAALARMEELRVIPGRSHVPLNELAEHVRNFIQNFRPESLNSLVKARLRELNPDLIP